MTAALATADAPMREVRADGLRLEPQRVDHADAMFAVLTDPALYEFEHEPPDSVESLRRRFAALEARRSPNGRQAWLHWVVRLDDGVLVGAVQATVEHGGQAAIAYEIGSAWWGRGIGTCAVAAMVNELAARHGVRHCSAVLKQQNLRSFHLLRRLRFTHASPAAHAARGVERDEWLMERTLPHDPAAAAERGDRSS